MVFTPGLVIGKYTVGRKLGQGGFGAVYVGHDTNLDREVALKFLHPEHTSNAQILQRFLQEARTAAKVLHPGIVTIYECGQVKDTGTAADGMAYIAMELLHGESLTDRLARSKRLSPDAAVEIARQVASALEAAHKAGIIHRDLKPDNVFIVEDPAVPSGERVKVLDFGIAKLAQTAQASAVHTASMMVFGTPRYMSPEQCRSAAHIDHRSDIYTLGCILFELVCGRPPFEGEPGELIAKHQLIPAPAARSFDPAIPVPLDELITMMLAKDVATRPQTMLAIQRALEGGGAFVPGVAPTLMPGAAESIRFAPSGLGIRPLSQPPAASSNAMPAAAPTTLSAAAGASHGPARRSKMPWLVAGAVVLVAAPLGAYAMLREPTADAVSQVAVNPPPPPPTPKTEPEPAKPEPVKPDPWASAPEPAKPATPSPEADALAAKFRATYAHGVARCVGKTTPVAKLDVTVSFVVETTGKVHHDLEWLAPAVKVPLEVTAVRDVAPAPVPIKKPPPQDPRLPIGNGVVDPFKAKDHHAK
jgi:eukaryotic-like serine/threonine-protein kinase